MCMEPYRDQSYPCAFLGVQKVFSLFRNKKASFKGINALNGFHMRVLNTESLNARAIHFKGYKCLHSFWNYPKNHPWYVVPRFIWPIYMRLIWDRYPVHFTPAHFVKVVVRIINASPANITKVLCRAQTFVFFPLVVFSVPSTARLFTDGTPVNGPLWSSDFTIPTGNRSTNCRLVVLCAAPAPLFVP